jgi:hypothetical protein
MFNFCLHDLLFYITRLFFPSDLIGVVTHVGPHDFARATSQIKLRKIKIMDHE